MTSLNKGESTLNGAILAGNTSTRRQEAAIDPDDAATIGFRSGSRSVSLFCMATFAELRDHDRGKLLILARFAGGQRVACEDTGERLEFSIDGKNVFSMPAGDAAWELYRGL